MEYTEVQFRIEPNTSANIEVLTAWVSDLPFDSFSETETGLNAYAPSSDFNQQDLDEKLNGFVLFQVEYSVAIIADQNWNKVWEENYFEPIVIGDKCLVRGSFHTDTPKVEWEIVIDPKMSFGSGHHATTKMMLEHLLNIDTANKTLLDMGCGTGILAILASMRNAKNVLAIDIDEWAYNNTVENATSNNQPQIEVKLGGAEQVGDLTFDIVLANINTNILLADMAVYQAALNTGGTLVMSGFYTSDKDKIIAKAQELGLSPTKYLVENDWNAIVFQ